MIDVYISGDCGYVWDAKDALRLRQEYRIIGSLIGGVAQFKNQNAVNGLPLQLNADEVTLLVQRGWATLKDLTLDVGRVAELARYNPSSTAPSTSSTNTAGQPGRPAWGGGHRAKKRRMEEEALEEYHAYYQGVGAYRQPCDVQAVHAAAHLPVLPVVAQVLRQAQAAASGQGALLDSQDGQGRQAAGSIELIGARAPCFDDERGKEVAWRAPVAEGTLFCLPINTQEAREQAGAGARLPVQQQGEVVWRYPSSAEQWLRFTVFTDLYDQGYCLSGGAKFGADMLAYPGDPSLFHAQFTVRLLQPGAPLNPILFKSAARGSHTARKHLLLASLPPEAVLPGGSIKAGAKPAYMSVAPEAGFGRPK